MSVSVCEGGKIQTVFFLFYTAAQLSEVIISLIILNYFIQEYLIKYALFY